MKILGEIIAFILTGLPILAAAQPDFSTFTTVEGIRCCRDVRAPGIAYYAPGKLSIGTGAEGVPDFNFIQTRYTGSYIYGDQGSSHFRSIVRFRVIMNRLEPAQLARVRTQLFPSGSKAELRPLPVSNIESLLGFTSLATSGETPDTALFRGGAFTSEGEEGQVQKGVFWKEREYSLRLDDHSSQILWDGLSKGQTIMSLSYAFFSSGVKTSSTDITSGAGSLTAELAKILAEAQDTARDDRYCILADAFSVEIDVNKWPALIKKLDVNEEIPPGYPALEVRCYDFSNNLRPDLYSKTVELKARGVGAGDVVTRIRFDRKNPDLSVFHVRFKHAVRIDQPLMYRITEITENELPDQTEWKNAESWNALIDVTSPGEKIIPDQEIEEDNQ